MLTRGMMARGMDAFSAKAAALRVLAGLVARQGTMIAFEKIFMLTGFMMLALLPLTFFLRSKDHEDAARERQRAANDGPAPEVIVE